MDLEALAKEYKITKEMAIRRALVPTENGRRTATKELIGEKVIKSANVWEKLFPNYDSVKRITSVKLQKDGVDFVIDDDTFIDIKVDIGPDYGNIIPIEIRQNHIFTMKASKKTDYLVHVIIDDYKKRVVMLNYQWIAKVAHKVAVAQANNEEIPWTIYTSNNGTGEYIKWDYTANDIPKEEAGLVIIDL